MSGAVISQVRLGASHDGAAELVLTLRFDSGGETLVALGEEAAGCLMTACDAKDADGLLGQGWERVRDALETSSNRFAGAGRNHKIRETHMYDLLIKNGNVVDGSGLPAYRADVAVMDGRIARIGRVAEGARRVVDAAGKVVAPGFIDPHTHFDAQLLWDGFAKPALAHGVTTIVPGNCSLSLAPLRAEHRMKLVGMFNQIEEMPLKAFREGVVWDWESFAGYIGRIRRGLAINVAPLVGHSVLRLWVMRQAAMERTATEVEIAEMQGVLRECLAAGAVGLSTSYVDMDERLQPVPSRYADAAEIDALASVLGEYGRMLQIVPEFYDADLTIARLDQLAELSLKYSIPTTFSPLFVNADNVEAVDRVMRRVDEQFDRGARVWPQVQTRPIDISFCFAVPSLLFFRMPTWYRLIRFGAPEDIVAAFHDPDRREKLLGEAAAYADLWPRLTLRHVNTEANRPLVGKTLGEIAALRGVTPIDAMIDLSIEEDLDAHFLSAGLGHNDDAEVGRLLAHPRVHIGASDGGAHILSFSTYGDTGYLLGHFVRERKMLSLEAAVKKVTSDTAAIWGIPDRGLLQPGYVADIVVFDPLTIDRGAEHYVADVPGDGSRYVRESCGIDQVFVGGALAWSSDGGYQDAHGEVLPGLAA